ncbi:MAG: hypothetical protein U5L10_00880 [Candidatus Moranbacteria bacterium]|nr:hypothetical protein [Candidatus Moranbacteria bacterium]
MSREGKSKIQISKELGIRKATIIEWLKQDKYQDKRGWKKDKARKYTDKRVGEKICQLREDRILEKSYFIGSEYLQMDYANNYPCEELPSDWFIKETIRRNNLQTRKPKKRKRAERNICFFRQDRSRVWDISTNPEILSERNILAGDPSL